MSVKKGWLLIPVALAAAFAGGFFCGGRMTAGSVAAAGDAPDPSEEELEVTVEDGGDEASADEVEGETPEESFEEAVDSEVFAREQTAGPEPKVEEVRDEDGRTADERLERLRHDRPEEYEALVRRRQERLDARQREQGRRRDFLEAVDPALMSEDEQRLHREFTDALAARMELRETVRKAVERGEPVSEGDHAALREAERAVRQRAAAERTLLLRAAARSLGLEDEAIDGFQQTVEDICSATSRR